jgi:hypothetical protein
MDSRSAFYEYGYLWRTSCPVLAMAAALDHARIGSSQHARALLPSPPTLRLDGETWPSSDPLAIVPPACRIPRLISRLRRIWPA